MAKISERVIGCAMAVSNELGVGFLESVYANALSVELREAGLRFEREKELAVFYKYERVGIYFADFLVEERLVVELKALSRLAPEHEAQVINYLRASHLQVALLLNFGTTKLGVKRVVLNHDDSRPI
ncbi:MAG: GxxExxY protein [Nevskia sp.]|nr:GxxExxY protein [Nevskia sp.]